MRLAKKYLLNSKPAEGPVRESDFEMHLEEVDVANYTEQLGLYGFASKTVAEFLYRDKKYPITQLDMAGTNVKKKLLIFAGVHGNEVAGVLAVKDLLGKFKKNPELYDEWSIRILTPVNPVGVSYMSRYNKDGYDINRDFKEFATLEARLQRDTITDYEPDILVTFHESPKDGFFIFSEGKLPHGLADKISQELYGSGVEIATKSYFGIKTKAGVWEKPTLIYALQRFVGMYTLGSHAHNLNIITLTTESTWSDENINSRKLPHILTVTAILKNSSLVKK